MQLCALPSLKVASFITLTPQSKQNTRHLADRTRKPGPVWGTALGLPDLKAHDYCSFDPSVQLQTLMPVGMRGFRQFWAAAALDLTLGSTQTPMSGLTPSKISHRLLLPVK